MEKWPEYTIILWTFGKYYIIIFMIKYFNQVV